MRKLKGYAIWTMAALLFVFMIGCACKNDECAAPVAADVVASPILRPTVTFVTPANLETGVPTNTAVTATFSEAMDPTTISTLTFTVTGPGSDRVNGPVTYDAINHIATLTPSGVLPPNTTFTATITTGANNLAGISLAVPFVWTFTTGAAPDITGPTVILTGPANAATGVALNRAVTAAFSEAMASSTINTATFTLYQGATQISGQVTYVGGIATFTPTSPLAPLTVYTATITVGATDVAGNALVAGLIPNPWTFTTGAAPDTTRPTVILTSPANAVIGVALNKAVTAAFSEAMLPATVISNFTLMQGATPISGTVTYVNMIATFTPSSPLAPLTVYTAKISSGAKDLAGNALIGGPVPNPWTFTTGAAPDTTRPTVILTSPANLAIGVPLNTAVTAAFSEEMNPATVIPNFTLMQGAIPIPGTVTYVGLIATFTPSSPLAPLTTYTATIAAGAKDLAGNALIAGPVPNPWTFTTGAASDTTSPTITLTNPANLATGVPLNSAVNATFSEAMIAGTVIPNFTLTGPGVTPVMGIVSYNLLTHIATFTPSNPLTSNTTYTATITNGATDLAGNPLVAGLVPNPWTFSTAAALGPLPVVLGAVAPFAIVSGSGISSVPASDITGNIGVSPFSGSSITGLTCPEINGTVYAVDVAVPPALTVCSVMDPAGLTAAKLALTVAYNDAAGRTLPAPATISGDQGGITLAPGIYKSTSTLLIQSGNLTLNGMGDANAVWIFQIASTLTTVGSGPFPSASGGNVMLTNGANAANVFWQVGTAATIGDYTDFYGTILAHDDISVNTGAHVHGRLLSGAQPSGFGAVTLIQNTVIMP